MIHRAERDADGGALVLARQRGKPGHRLDHRSPTGRLPDLRDRDGSLTSPRVGRRRRRTDPRTSAARRAARRRRPAGPAGRRAADLGDAAALEHDDRVGAADGRQPVRDDERRAVPHQVGERILHQQLRLGVERRGRLVENQDRRVLQQRARDREPLPLPARQPLAALADRASRSRSGSAAMNSCACAARAAASICRRRRARHAVGDVGARSCRRTAPSPA